ncbi:DUF2844 domain-containing protein [Robbsia sp. Bb-Pol-6]|uniref:DUF2844 domain-containing protein n=1 Tax=Robbsia betulipollinis TaxID=2981849 RepID=A0ABT3ZGP3_9BURK|nr:DUF2844 domain-containing protein [Robbsia betulipollinis]MCY0385701.1 DUF2844 domain-containing protein [Robbsia betulipollinis]
MANLHASLHRWLHRRVPGALFAVAGLLSLSGPPARAALGGGPTTVTQDRQVLGGSAVVATTLSVKQATAATTTAASTTAVAAAGYTVTTITTDAGTTVNEYATTAGVVFAIAWSGPQIPDLRQLLGDYFSTYASANAAQAASSPGSRGPARVDMDDLVVHSGGRMRSFQGSAYLKSQLPAGFNVDDIR